MTKPFASLKIGPYLIPHPIIQGGMAVKVSGANLAGAVANAGGMGVISSAGLGFKSPYFRKMRFPQANLLALIDELAIARVISPEGIIGVNVMACTKDYLDLAQTAARNGAQVIIAGAGVPLQLPESTQNYPQVALVPMVANFSCAQKICQHWQQEYHRLPDALIVENTKCIGGHVATDVNQDDCGCDELKNLLHTLKKYLRNQWGINIPLIVAGGVWHREDIAKMLEFGADGVQMGTRFITTVECDADWRYKMFHLNATPEDLVIVPSPVGKPGRAIRNTFAEKAMAASPELEQRCVANCLESCLCRDEKETYCLVQALANAASGDLDNGLVFSGSNLGQAERIMPVAELMAELTGALVAI